jgi:hypothetical protein
MAVDYSGETIFARAIKTGWQQGTASSNITGAGVPATVVATANTTMTEQINLGRPLYLNLATGFTVTLPAATGTGNTYTIVVQTTASGGNYVVSAAGSDKIFGTITVAGTTNGSFVANNNVTVTMNGTTQGGIKGSTLFYTDMGPNFWFVEGNLVGSGTVQTPVS